MRNDDWVLVPREPTPEMRAAGERERLSNPTNMNPYHVWAAMLSAAPATEVRAQGVEGLRKQLSTLADTLADNSTTTDSGLPVTVAELLEVQHAAAQEIRALLSAAPAPADRLPVSWADFWISKGNWQLANDYAAFELANQWLDANITAQAAKLSAPAVGGEPFYFVEGDGIRDMWEVFSQDRAIYRFGYGEEAGITARGVCKVLNAERARLTQPAAKPSSEAGEANDE